MERRKLEHSLMRLALFLCSIILLTATGPGVVWAITADEDRTTKLYESIAPATVFLFTAFAPTQPLSTSSSVGVGSGFILDETGTVLTNAHVVAGATTITATLFDGQKVNAVVVGSDPQTDVAVVQLAPIKGHRTTVRLGDSDHLKVGQKVLVVGSPFGLGFTLTTGIVSGWGSPLAPVMRGDIKMIQTTAPINPGNSGGPVVDSDGKVVGMTTAMISGAQNIGFAIPINRVKEILEELKSNGHVARPWLGVTGSFPTEAVIRLFSWPMTAGLLLADVEEGSPAANAGLRAGTLRVTVEGVPWILGGDILVSIKGKPVRSAEEFVEVGKRLNVGEAVDIEFLREGEIHRIRVPLRERPAVPMRPPGHSGSQIRDTLTSSMPWMAQSNIVAY